MSLTACAPVTPDAVEAEACRGSRCQEGTCEVGADGAPVCVCHAYARVRSAECPFIAYAYDPEPDADEGGTPLLPGHPVSGRLTYPEVDRDSFVVPIEENHVYRLALEGSPHAFLGLHHRPGVPVLAVRDVFNVWNEDMWAARRVRELEFVALSTEWIDVFTGGRDVSAGYVVSVSEVGLDDHPDWEPDARRSTAVNEGSPVQGVLESRLDEDAFRIGLARYPAVVTLESPVMSELRLCHIMLPSLRDDCFPTGSGQVVVQAAGESVFVVHRRISGTEPLPYTLAVSAVE